MRELFLLVEFLLVLGDKKILATFDAAAFLAFGLGVNGGHGGKRLSGDILPGTCRSKCACAQINLYSPASSLNNKLYVGYPLEK